MHQTGKVVLIASSIILIVLGCSWLPAAVEGPPKHPYVDLPGDQPREHVEVIRSSGHRYVVPFRGTIDGVMTRMPISYQAYVQGWQPNRLVRLENIGVEDVRNPRIVVNGKRRWASLEEITAEAVGSYTLPPDRARALYEFQRSHRFHATTWDAECQDIVKVLNVYGYSLCGNEAVMLNDLWRTAGFATRRCRPVGHVVTEVFYDGGYHLLDSDEHVICLRRDNRTIASEAEIVRDHDLVKRTHTYGISAREQRDRDEFSASLYGNEEPRDNRSPPIAARHRMDLVLRPGESIEFHWDHRGKEYSAGRAPEPGKPWHDGIGTLTQWGPVAHDDLRNARLRYRPDLRQPTAERGVSKSEGIRWDHPAGRLIRAEGQKPAYVQWQFTSPYVFVGASCRAAVEISGEGRAAWEFSADGRQWQRLAAADRTGRLAARVGAALSPPGRPMYQFRLRLVLEGTVNAADVEFDHDLQTSLLALPELEVGENQVVYQDDETGSRQVRITHSWMERTGWRRALAPAEAITPQDGQVVEGTQVRFRWKPANDPGGDAIVDYHFQLSEHADMRWPLSPNFDKLVSLTPSRGKAEWTIPYVGLLNPDTKYYWRVRAKSIHGVFSPWSKTFHFTAEGPGVPEDVRLVAEGTQGWRLAWRANPLGRRPKSYRVYGSDERGFSVADDFHLVNRGKGLVRSMEEYEQKPPRGPDVGLVRIPGNFIASSETTSLVVIGPQVPFPNANKGYYRVVAVDARGNRSGPSDYVECRRPLIFTRPLEQTRRTAAYEYRPGVIRSLGDLRCRVSKKSSYNAAFWDWEELAFEANGLPAGLTIDAKTGRIAGAAKQPGSYAVEVQVRDQFGKKTSQAYRLVVTP